jgi:hypothetical protein
VYFETNIFISNFHADEDVISKKLAISFTPSTQEININLRSLVSSNLLGQSAVMI